MSILPRKTTPQEWEDIALPGLEDLPHKEKRQRSKKDEDDEQKVAWRRYRGARDILCHECIEERGAGLLLGAPQRGAYIRFQGKTERYFCFKHHTQERDREQLEKPRGG